MNGPRSHGRNAPNMMHGRQGRGRPPLMRGGPPPRGGRFPPAGRNRMRGGPPPFPPHRLPPPPPPMMRGRGMGGPFIAQPPQRGPAGRPPYNGRGRSHPHSSFRPHHPNNPNPPPNNLPVPPPPHHQQPPHLQRLPPHQPHHPPNNMAPGRVTNLAPQHQQRRHSAPPSSSFSQAQIDQAWTTHTPQLGGQAFYYNSITKVSVFELPEALRKQQQQPQNALAPTTSPSTSVWKEYLDAKSGKKYYSNGTTTTWDLPPELQLSQPSEPTDPPKSKKRKIVEHNFGSKEESIAAFKGLLLAKEVSPTAKWQDAVKLCQSPRWENCEAALTVGERKQALAEYQTKRANELRALERQEKARAKESFMELLTEILPNTAGFSAWTSRWDDVRDSLTKDDRFHTVATEDTRESLFLDFCEEFKKREERRKRNKKKEAEEVFIAFLSEKEDEGKLSFASTWGSFSASLAQTDKEDRRFVLSSSMSDADRQLYFANFVIELQSAEDEKRQRIRGARKRAEIAQREAFEEGLRQLALEGKLLPSSRWNSAEGILEEMPCYGPVRDQGVDVPRQIFDQFVGNWVEVYRRDRDVLSQLLPSKLTINSETSYEDFTKAMMDVARESSSTLAFRANSVINSTEPVSSARLYLKELTGGLAVEPAKGKSSVATKDPDSSEDEGEVVEEDDGT